MFKIKFARTFDFAIMSKNNLDHVLEDYFVTTKNAFCIADGITRELVTGKPLKYPTTKEEALEILKDYPNPSGATLAAKTCAEKFISYISKRDVSKMSTDIIYKVMKAVNKDISKINEGRKIDYLVNDEYACCAVGGVFQDEVLYAFAVGDCKMMLLDENLDIVADTSSSTAYNDYKDSYKMKCFRNADWMTNKEFRVYIRKTMRNNIWYKLLKRHTFGVLNGDTKALYFIERYKFDLSKVKYILAFSDGCVDCLQTKEQIASVLENPEHVGEERHEKTLIIYERI